MAQSNWESDKMLDIYIHDYLVKKKLFKIAESFRIEGKVSPDPVAIDAPGGFLFEWWSVFWDIFIGRNNEKHSEAQQGIAKEQQMQLQQLHMMRQAQMQCRDPNHPSLGSEAMHGQPNANALAAKLYKERMKQPNPMNSETSQPYLDARMTLHGQMVQGNHQGGVSAGLQQIQSRTQQNTETRFEVNLGTSQRQLPMDPSTVYGQGILQSKPRMGNAGLNPVVSDLPLKEWPSLYGDMVPRRFTGLPRGNINLKDGQQNSNDGSIRSPMQSSSSKHINTPPLQQSSSQQQDPLLSQQSQQNNLKRKGSSSSSGPDSSTGTGNIVGPSNSQPSTPSTTHTPVPKGPVMYGSDGIGGLASSANQLYEDVGAVEDIVELRNGGSLFGTLEQNPSEHTETSKDNVEANFFLSQGFYMVHGNTRHPVHSGRTYAHIITDIRFRPNSTQLATSSLDKTFKICDASVQPGYYLRTIAGHNAHVMSRDFHPKKI